VLAAGVVAATVLGALRAVVLPRASSGLAPRLATEAVRRPLSARARRATAYAERDRIMAILAPVALLTLLATWLLTLLAAYAAMFFCLGAVPFTRAVELSGSSIFTLGTTSDRRFSASLLSYSEAGLGLLLLALFITYFPSIYGAFTRREAGVTLLQVRAGDPPQAATMLIRYHRIEGRRYQINDLWRQWEVWFADLEESHTTFPILVFFRSPQPERSWITAAGALLDGAAFWVACVADHPADPDAQLCLRAGFLALRRVADAFGLAHDPDPRPDGPISVSRQEWDSAMAEMEAAGVPLIDDRDAAWAAWRGWRVNYDQVLLRLARLVEAPPAPWLSDRSPTGPGRRSTGRPGWLRRLRPARG
jgi:hypothetical protein